MYDSDFKISTQLIGLDSLKANPTTEILFPLPKTQNSGI